MRIVIVFLNLVALHCTVSPSPPSPANVILWSVNLRNLLQWVPGNGTPEDTHFTVQYAIYGDSVEGNRGRRVHWRAVRQCTEIVRTWCDLSNETWDLEQGYHARVRAVSRRASSKWALTRRRFDPKSDTAFGPPLVSVDVNGNNAIISLKGPMRYLPNNHTPAVSMATLYPHMFYNLSIHIPRRGEMGHLLLPNSPYKYRLMAYDTEYCFSAKARFLYIPIQCQSSAWYCITTPPDPVIGQLQRMVVGIVVPSVCLGVLVVVGYLLYHYLTGKGQKSPYILSPPSFHMSPLTFPPENLKPIIITFIKPSDIEIITSGPEFSKRQIADPPPGYSSQRPEIFPQPEEPWDDLSIDYGFVGVAPEINDRGEEERREERERRHDGREDGNSLRGEHKKDAARGSHKVKEWRVEDGRSAGVYAPQAKSDAQTEMSTLIIQAHAFSQLNSVLPTRTQAPLLSFQGATKGEVDREIGLFPNPLNLQTNQGGGMGGEMDGMVRVRTDGWMDGGVEEGSDGERAPLLFAYASQNVRAIPTSHDDQSDFLSDDYGVLRLATAHQIKEDGEEEEEEEGTICINWNPETRKLVLPEVAMEVNKEGGLNGSMEGEKGRENRVGGEEEEEEAYVTNGELRLENVFVRQASEEEAEAQGEMERGGEISWEVDDVLTKWNLVISMDR
ncbi:interleukin-20 receptor subunit alpha [Pempheris klunzingeri]|uniref:interleukin-20 receptor subunit alpha n=1 Tax=Pempheris klunzingeri TaxID=3127111 RepID=UPI00397EDFB8